MEETLAACRPKRRKGGRVPVQELRLVLLGQGWLEKSLTGNTILQREMFDTGRDVKMCVRRQSSDHKGRRIVVVNTPDRWVQYNVQDPGLIQDNVAECLSMCQPGPHAFLMVVPLDLNKGKEWTVEGPLQLLTDNVWKNTMVIFTKPEKLKGTSIKDYTANRTFLGPLLEKCGHRCHLLDTSFYGHESQVEELLEKVNAMIKDKGVTQEDRVFSDVGMFLNDQKAVEEKAKLRLRNAQASKNVLRSVIGMREAASDLHILIVGPKGSGKSSSGNTILCQDAFQTSRRTSLRSAGRAEVSKRNVTVVDTPGWHGRYYTQDTPFEALQEIVQSSKDQPSAVLLVFRCDETFTETDRLKGEEHMSLLGEWVWSRTVVLFTHRDKLGGGAIEEHIERWPALQWLVNKCGNRYHVLNNSDKSGQSQVRDLLEMVAEVEVLNDAHFLLQCYTQMQERYKNLEANCNKLELELEKRKDENEKLSEMLAEKEGMNNELMETILQKDNEVWAYKNALEDANARLKLALLRLEKAEKDNEQVIKCLGEKDKAIAGLLGEREEAQQIFEVERERLHQKLNERKYCMEMEVKQLEEENKQLKTENECSKIMLKSVMVEVQKHFRKNVNLRRKMTTDGKTLEMLFRLESEETTASDKNTCKQKQDIQPWEISKKCSGCCSSQWAWLMAEGAALGAVVGAALGAVVGCSRAEGGLRLNLSSAAGAAAGVLLGFCWTKTRTETGHRQTATDYDTKSVYQ